MNRFFLLLVTATAATMLMVQHASLSEARAHERQLARQAESAMGFVQSAEAQATALTNDLESVLTLSRDLKQALAEWDAQPELVADLPVSIEPGQRWPSDQPWCYLPKRDLLRYGFTPITPAGRLSDPAVVIFGMSPTQRARVEDAYAEWRREQQALDLAYMNSVTIPDANRQPGYEIRSYELNLSAEPIAEPFNAFETSVRAALSEKQGNLFLKVCEAQRSRASYRNSNSVIRLTASLDLSSPRQDYESIEVERRPLQTRGDLHGASGMLWPEDDEDALAFHYFADLIHAYEARQVR